jgi:hypothetical protein
MPSRDKYVKKIRKIERTNYKFLKIVGKYSGCSRRIWKPKFKMIVKDMKNASSDNITDWLELFTDLAESMLLFKK